MWPLRREGEIKSRRSEEKREAEKVRGDEDGKEAMKLAGGIGRETHLAKSSTEKQGGVAGVARKKLSTG